MSNLLHLSNNKNVQLRYSRFLDNFPRLTLGSLITAFICIIMMIAATFTILPTGFYDPAMLTAPEVYFSNINNLIVTLHTQLYSPQIPVALFAGALLGPRMGTVAIGGYVLMGLLGIPVFAAGGGPSYVFEPVFGFIIGYIVAAYLVGKVLSTKINSLNIIFAVLVGIVTVHVFGLVYLIGNMYLAGYSLATIKAWAFGLSLQNLPYDLFFSLILCSLARPIRGLLWIALD